MSFEWIGLATVIAGCIGLMLGPRFAVPALIVSTLLGAAAAAILTALGGANLPPAHLLLGFLILVAARFGYGGGALKALSWPQPGFWLLLTAIYGSVGALFLPRLFAGASYVFTFARTDFGTGRLLVPVGPVSGNITQTAYFIGDVVAFCLFSAFARDRAGRNWIVIGFVAAAGMNLVFGALDYLTFFTNTTDYIAFLRNAPYRMLDTAEVIGIKRLVGSFPEAAAFAAVTLCLFAFMLNLWLNGHRTRITGPLALASALALILSTSATAYGGLTLYLAAVYGSCLLRAAFGTIGSQRVVFLVIAPLAAGAIVCALALNDRTAAFFGDAIQQLILTKGETDSAVERSSWNAQALTNFFESYGLGLGIGSARASNTAIAVLANLGIPGAVTYAVFIFGVLVAPLRDEDDERRGLRESAGSACVALALTGLLAGTSVDLGLTFFALAALAATPGEVPAEASLGAVRPSTAPAAWPRHPGRAVVSA